MGRRRGLLSLGLIVLAAGCPGYTSGIRRGASVDARYAYLYGRFYMNAPPNEFGARQSLGFLIRCQNGNEYVFGSLDSRDVQVLQILPSRCWLIELQAANQSGAILKRYPADPRLQRPLDFIAGRTHYIGDYFAKGDFWVRFRFVKIHHWEWAMSPAHDRYESTTAEMKATFPNLASWPTMAMPLILPPERKRDNGIGPSPGEPPLSPERVASVAPLINRNYASPAECEAACPAGQCFPYRGETGPAMACVIRCDRDADCPEGLACNCPNPERATGPGCRPIAATPQDAMARICLSVEAAGQRR